jgi:hypothetical protein
MYNQFSFTTITKGIIAKSLFVFLFLGITNISAQTKTITLSKSFDKIIVSPHIEAVFVQGDTPSVQIESITEPVEKFKYEIENNILQVYLEGAKTYTENEKTYRNGRKFKKPIYKNTVAKVIITYSSVETFSVRGEEKITFQSPLHQDKCILRIYGESEVLIKDVKLNDLRVAIYGESHLVIENGSINKQRITAYGESKVNTLAVANKETKITAYGDGSFQFNTSDRLKITSYGEATIAYKGNPTLKKGIVIGETEIVKM